VIHFILIAGMRALACRQLMRVIISEARSDATIFDEDARCGATNLNQFDRLPTRADTWFYYFGYASISSATYSDISSSSNSEATLHSVITNDRTRENIGDHNL
jgi:hypothetical protein